MRYSVISMDSQMLSAPNSIGNSTMQVPLMRMPQLLAHQIRSRLALRESDPLFQGNDVKKRSIR